MHPRIIFMGSPEFAAASLEALLKADYPVVGVVTQPDRPAGRGRVLTAPPVKRLAQAYGLVVIQPTRLKEPGVYEQLQAWSPDLIVVAAFGQILRQNVLDLPRYGSINVHASLLPRWRGAAPIQAALLAGDAQTGITIMRMDAGIDTGPILTQRAVEIAPDETAASLTERLARQGAALLLATLPEYLAGEISPRPQDDTRATYASMLKKEDGQMDFSQPAEQIARQVRAFNPWPGAFTYWDGQILKVLAAHPVDSPAADPGKTAIYQGLPAVSTSQGVLVLDQVQPAGKKPMSGKVFVNGARSWGVSTISS